MNAWNLSLTREILAESKKIFGSPQNSQA